MKNNSLLRIIALAILLMNLAVCVFAENELPVSHKLLSNDNCPPASQMSPIPMPPEIDYQSPILEYYINAPLGLSSIQNKDIDSGAIWDSKGKIGFNIEFGYFNAINAYLRSMARLSINTFGDQLTIHNPNTEYSIKDDACFNALSMSFIGVTGVSLLSSISIIF